METTDIYKPKLLEIITRHLPKCRIILFGSRARKTARQGIEQDFKEIQKEGIVWKS